MVKAGSRGIDAAIIIGAARFSWNRENSRGDITIIDRRGPPRLRDVGSALIEIFRKLYNPARIFPLPRLATSKQSPMRTVQQRADNKGNPRCCTI
jgi:hypothetical protein